MNHQTPVLWLESPEQLAWLTSAEMDGYLGLFGLQVQRTRRGIAPSTSPDEAAAVWIVDAQGLSEAQIAAAIARAQTQHAAVIVLMPSASPMLRAHVLDMGADDCLSAPFEKRELAARLQALIRRQERRRDQADAASAQWVRFGPWLLDTHRRRLSHPIHDEVTLSHAEFRLLLAFLSTPRQVFSRDRLMDEARGRGMEAFERSIDLLVSRLRHKLGDNPRQPRLIQTVRGQGYVFNAQPSVHHAVAHQH
jgi:two-component system OmpR family response regulator